MYYNLGPADIPPAPAGIAMTGRDDGLVYWLSDDGAGNLLLRQDASLPRGWGATVRGPFDGPLLPSELGNLRLYVTGGAISYELASPRGIGVVNSRILTRRVGHTSLVYELTAPSPFSFGDALTFTCITVIPDEINLRITLTGGNQRVTKNGTRRKTKG